MRLFILLMIGLMTSCGDEVKVFDLSVFSEEMIPEGFNLVEVSTAKDLECLEMRYQISGVSEGKKAFDDYIGEGSLDIDAMISELSKGDTITLSKLVEAWKSPAQIEPKFSLKSLKILVNGYYSLCHKGKKVSVLFYGEKSFSETDLKSESLFIPFVVTTLMPVNATEEKVKKIDDIHKNSNSLAYILLDHQQNKENIEPFFCRDKKVARGVSNSISVTPYFVKLDESSTYSKGDPMFTHIYADYFNYDFNFRKREPGNLTSFEAGILIPIFPHLPYDITYREGNGDGCETETAKKSLSTSLLVNQSERDECYDQSNTILECLADFDLTTNGKQDHLCTCINVPQEFTE